jgi:GrpB-like predicted nucleotidyltransferase (UPF0157 family)
MDRAQSLARALVEPVALSAHDAGWAAAFERERARLVARLPGRFVDVRHVGSTAVPGLVAKPVIDILAGVPDFAGIEDVLRALQACGYAYVATAAPQAADRFWLFRHLRGRRTHHLHVVVHGTTAWHERVDFCERLRGDAALRERYQALKLALLQRVGTDRDAFTAGKEPFIRAVLDADPTTPASGAGR